MDSLGGIVDSNKLLSEPNLERELQEAENDRCCNRLPTRESTIEKDCGNHKVLDEMDDQELHFDLTLPIQAMKRTVAKVNGMEKTILFPGMLVTYPAMP